MLCHRFGFLVALFFGFGSAFSPAGHIASKRKSYRAANTPIKASSGSWSGDQFEHGRWSGGFDNLLDGGENNNMINNNDDGCGGGRRGAGDGGDCGAGGGSGGSSGSAGDESSSPYEKAGLLDKRFNLTETGGTNRASRALQRRRQASSHASSSSLAVFDVFKKCHFTLSQALARVWPQVSPLGLALCLALLAPRPPPAPSRSSFLVSSYALKIGAGFAAMTLLSGILEASRNPPEWNGCSNDSFPSCNYFCRMLDDLRLHCRDFIFRTHSFHFPFREDRNSSTTTTSTASATTRMPTPVDRYHGTVSGETSPASAAPASPAAKKDSLAALNDGEDDGGDGKCESKLVWCRGGGGGGAGAGGEDVLDTWSPGRSSGGSEGANKSGDNKNNGVGTRAGQQGVRMSWGAKRWREAGNHVATVVVSQVLQKGREKWVHRHHQADPSSSSTPRYRRFRRRSLLAPLGPNDVLPNVLFGQDKKHIRHSRRRCGNGGDGGSSGGREGEEEDADDDEDNDEHEEREEVQHWALITGASSGLGKEIAAVI
jgi:hypothetical protein